MRAIGRLGWVSMVLGCVWAIGSPPASAQSTSAASRTASPAALPSAEGRSGAGAMADFQSLINLIQTTVDSNWEVDGGEDTITQYPNGVWIDTHGKLHRLKTSSAAAPSGREAPKAVKLELPWLTHLQAEEPLRWVSLTELMAALEAAAAEDQSASAELKLLGGLSRLDYVAWDEALQQWCLGGPAGDFELHPTRGMISHSTGLPPMLLEDLLAVAPRVLQSRGPLGCSIDPVPERLKATSDLVNSPLAVKSLRQRPEQWANKLAETLGEQQAVVFGLPEDSPTAAALLVADEHMKRIGLGLDPGPGALLSYWEQAEKRGAIPASSLIRWWFALRDDIVIETDASGHVHRLASPTVRVLSQRQWMDAAGKRQDADRSDPAADAFAADFTEQFDALQTMHPAYARLRHVFDLCVAMQLIADETRAGRPSAPESLRLGKFQPALAAPLKWIPSVAAHRKTSVGRVAAIVSGGVSIDTRSTKPQRQSSDRQMAIERRFEFQR